MVYRPAPKTQPSPTRLLPAAILGLFLLIGMVLGAKGCVRTAPMAEVCGTASFDEKPLAEGEIYFTTPGMTPEILPIKNGQFSGKVRLGQRRVEVYAYRGAELSPTATMTTEPSMENFIPATYNAKSTLQAVVEMRGPNRFEFDLKSSQTPAPPP